jgi:hypothetical protein
MSEGARRSLAPLFGPGHRPVGPAWFFIFLFIQNRLNFKNSKWVPYLAPKIPNFCVLLAWDIVNNFLGCADIKFPI